MKINRPFLRFVTEGEGAEGGAGAEGGDGGASGGKAAEFSAITTQADLDRILGARLAREREKVTEKYGDLNALKAAADEHAKAIEAARTEQEKAVEAAKNEGRTEALTAANTRLLSAEARALAAEAKFANPALAVRALDLSDIKVNEDGSVDAAAIKTKLTELADTGAFVIETGEKPKPKPDRAQGGATKPAGGKLSGLGGSDLYDRLHPKKTTA